MGGVRNSRPSGHWAAFLCQAIRPISRLANPIVDCPPFPAKAFWAAARRRASTEFSAEKRRGKFAGGLKPP